LPFYVGKGKDHRAWSKTRSVYWHRIVKKHGLVVEILANWGNEQDAFDHEKFIISCFKDMGYKLCNLTDGGEGASGNVLNEEARRKISIAAKKYCSQPHVSDERRKRIILTNKSESNSFRGKAAIRQNIHSNPEVMLKVTEAGKRNCEKINSDEELTFKRKTMLSEHNRSDKAKEHLAKMQSSVHSNVEIQKRRIQATILARSRSVTCVETGTVFSSASDAARWLSEVRGSVAGSTHIAKSCKSDKFKAYGYRWVYT
jgi:hypothetical protein